MKFKTGDKNFEKKLNDELCSLIDDQINDELTEVSERVEEYYESNRDFYEIATLKNEDDKSKDKHKRINTQLEIKQNKKDMSLNISVNVDNKVDKMILRAQNTGTGLGVNENILKAFDVKEEDEKNVFFSPKGTDVIFKNDLKSVLNAKKD